MPLLIIKYDSNHLRHFSRVFAATESPWIIHRKVANIHLFWKHNELFCTLMMVVCREVILFSCHIYPLIKGYVDIHLASLTWCENIDNDTKLHRLPFGTPLDHPWTATNSHSEHQSTIMESLRNSIAWSAEGQWIDSRLKNGTSCFLHWTLSIMGTKLWVSQVRL